MFRANSRLIGPLSSTLMLAVLSTACGTDEDDAGFDTEPPPEETFKNPGELDLSGGVGALTAGLSKVEIAGQDYCLRTYNGQLPGPTIVVPKQLGGADRELRLDITNAFGGACMGEVGGMAPNSKCECDPNTKSCYDFNSTNFHTHGLHVSPGLSKDGQMLSDHVLMHLNHDGVQVMQDAPAPPPGACEQTAEGHMCRYKFDIDEGSKFVDDRDQHEPGTFWYHAHVHGATAMQLANGMAGALIIRGPVDEIPAVAAAAEKIMVLQQIPYQTATPIPNGQTCDPKNPDHYSTNAFGDVALEGTATLINGVVEPVIYMDAGELQRWRLVLGGISAETKVALRGPVAPGTCAEQGLSKDILPVQEIAADGITFTHMRERATALRLDPGYRSDILVQLPADAEQGMEYCLFDEPGTGLLDETTEEKRSLIARVYVNGAREPMALPTNEELRAIAKEPMDCATDNPDRTTVFAQKTDAMTNEKCPSFNIDCKVFPNAKFDLQRDTQEVWKLSSQGGRHPFHIHVNPFTVCEEEGQRLDEGYWRDTLLMDPSKGYEIRTRYQGFLGKFVLHCHRLDHEDRGMMGLVNLFE